MASQIPINAVARQLLKPGAIERAKRFFTQEYDVARESKDRIAIREADDVLRAIEEYERQSAKGTASDAAKQAAAKPPAKL